MVFPRTTMNNTNNICIDEQIFISSTYYSYENIDWVRVDQVFIFVLDFILVTMRRVYSWHWPKTIIIILNWVYFEKVLTEPMDILLILFDSPAVT